MYQIKLYTFELLSGILRFLGKSSILTEKIEMWKGYQSLCLGLICLLFSVSLLFFLQEIYYNYPI